MQRIYHLVPRTTWEEAPSLDFKAASLAIEGFIHCSLAHQVASAANRFYAGTKELLLLHLEPSRLTSPVREEPSSSGELFPHVYGPIDREAIAAVQPMVRDAEGQWIFTNDEDR